MQEFHSGEEIKADRGQSDCVDRLESESLAKNEETGQQKEGIDDNVRKIDRNAGSEI